MAFNLSPTVRGHPGVSADDLLPDLLPEPARPSPAPELPRRRRAGHGFPAGYH